MTPNSVIIVNSYGSVNGGATRVAIDEAVGLAESGIPVTFFSAVGPISEELRSAPLRVLCLNQRDLFKGSRSPTVAFQGLWNHSAYEAMGHLLDASDQRTTVVHIHSFSQAMSASPIISALHRGFKVICTLHDYFLACPNGGFFDFPARSECTLRPLSFSCATRNCDKRRYSHKLYRLLRTGFQWHVCDVPKALKNYIALSSHSTAKIRPYLPHDARVFHLPNPCLIPKRPPVDLLRNREIVAVGRLDPEKGIELLVKAGEIANLRILFIGDGPLRSVAEASGLNEVTGWLPRTELLEKLETARCLVFPSLWPETYGLTVMDAAARGIPAVVSDITGIAERIENDVTGWHIGAANLDQLVSRLRATQDAATMSALGAATYARYWHAPLTQEKHITDLLGIYEKILADAV